jgi:hypothetical protein
VDNFVGCEPSWATTTCTSVLLKSTPVVGGKPTRTAGALAPRSGSGAAAALGPWGWRPRDALASRRRDVQGVNVTTSLVADRRFVIIIVASFDPGG